jgi:hypothetical protein
MLNENTNFIGSIILLAVIAFMSISVMWFPKHTRPYKLGVEATHKEAFEHGLMTKEITKDDKVVYRWIETHKLGYEKD